MMTGVTTLPPKMAAQYAERAKRMDGCISVGQGAYEFAQGTTVVVLMDIDPPFGHFGKDAECVGIIQSMNVSNGYPLGVFCIRRKKAEAAK